LNKFIAENYNAIMLMSKKICKSSIEYEDVGHFAIAEFMEHERGQELVDAGRAMNFISGIIWRSFNSSTSQYHTLYRQKGRVHSLPTEEFEDVSDTDYNFEQDIVTEAISGILEDMLGDTNELWFRAMLFQMYLDTPNYSQISRRTKIPRTSISQAVDECKEYIREQLKNRNINYEL